MNINSEIEHDFEEIIYLNKPFFYCLPPSIPLVIDETSSPSVIDEQTTIFTINWETAKVDQPPSKAQLMTLTKPQLKQIASQGHYSIGQFSHSKNTYYIENISKLNKPEIVNSIINIWGEIVSDKQNIRMYQNKMLNIEAKPKSQVDINNINIMPEKHETRAIYNRGIYVKKRCERYIISD